MSDQALECVHPPNTSPLSSKGSIHLAQIQLDRFDHRDWALDQPLGKLISTET